MTKNTPIAPADAVKHERLLHLLHYDPATGVFRWRVTLSNRAPAGKRAGCKIANGYTQIRIDRVLYSAHRLAWFYVHGVWPPDEIDHRHGVEHGDSIDNLRPATHQQNLSNRSKTRANSTGHKGVTRSRCGRKFCARIKVSGKLSHLGTFDTVEAASAAYHKAAATSFGEFYRTGDQ